MSARGTGFAPGLTGPDIVRGDGCYLFTSSGRRIFDAAGGAIVANIGHGRADVRDAVARAMSDLTYIVPSFNCPYRSALADTLRNEWLPGRLANVFFTSGGSEAVDASFRVARQYHVARRQPGRWKILARDISYHGATVATLDTGGHDGRRAAVRALGKDLPKAPAPYPLRRNEDCAAALETLIRSEGPETIAAFVAEPITGSSGGCIVPPPDYWPRVQEICRRYGILLIVDEVMVGFGRTGARFALEHFGIDADLMIAGKGLAAGYAPIVGLYATDEIVETLAEAGQSLMFYTYGGHPAACAAASAVLDIMTREDLVARAAAMGRVLEERLAPLRQHPHVADVRGSGLFWALEIVRDRDRLECFPLEAAITQNIVAAGLEDGYFFYPGGTGTVRDVIVLGPPFIVSEDDIDRMTAALARAIDAGIAAGRV